MRSDMNDSYFFIYYTVAVKNGNIVARPPLWTQSNRSFLPHGAPLETCVRQQLYQLIRNAARLINRRNEKPSITRYRNNIGSPGSLNTSWRILKVDLAPHRWHDYKSNDLVLREAGLRQVTCIVRERQLRLYGHVARLHAEDPAHRILSCQDPRGWSMSRGSPHAS